MQIASVFIWKTLNHPNVSFLVAKILGVSKFSISLNDVCCYVPVGFGAFATFLIFCFTWVTSGSANGATVAALIMAIIPGTYCIALYCIALHRIASHCIALHCIVV
jgi:hypothetical protein